MIRICQVALKLCLFLVSLQLTSTTDASSIIYKVYNYALQINPSLEGLYFYAKVVEFHWINFWWSRQVIYLERRQLFYETRCLAKIYSLPMLGKTITFTITADSIVFQNNPRTFELFIKSFFYILCGSRQSPEKFYSFLFFVGFFCFVFE